MTPDLLDLTATPERLHALAQAGVLPPSELEQALQRSVATPERPAWRSFLSAVLLALGSLLVLSGIIYFFAYNWAALHHFAKLGLIVAALTGACVAAWRLGEGLAGQFSLLFAAVLVGPLLAVYGQAYQTGADPYELFLGWSLLVLPWVVLARFAPLWLWQLLLVNTGLFLYGEQVAGWADNKQLLIIAGVNTGAWVAHELFSAAGVPWLHGRWMPRVLSVMALTPLVILAEQVVLDTHDRGRFCELGFGLLLLAMGMMYYFHRRVRPELFFLTSNALMVMILVTSFCGKHLFKAIDEAFISFFLMALVVMLQVGTAVWWLRAEARGAREVES